MQPGMGFGKALERVGHHHQWPGVYGRAADRVSAVRRFSPRIRTVSSFLQRALCLLIFFAAVPAHAFVPPPGFDGFQFTPPYNTKNPFSADVLKAVDRGFMIFTTETFNGNGRVCSTCHLPDKDYNVSAADIAAMSAADQDKVLATGTDLENSEITEKLGLFDVNQGFGPGTEGDIATPEGPFRASMSLGGFGFTTLNNFVCRPGTPTPGGTACTPGTDGLPGNNLIVDDGTRDNMTGWGGDGALVDMFGYTGSPVPAAKDCEDVVADFDNNPTNLEKGLVSFALDAVKTHFTRSQDRVPGVDFRCPTAQELLDMAKLQEWLGRRFELDIRKLTFSAPAARTGLRLFSSREASCVGCHVNAGASDTQGRVKLFPVPFLPQADDNGGKNEPLEIIGANKSSRTGIQFLEPTLDAMVAAAFPLDEGDGELRAGGTQGGFNVQSLPEAARKTQFFHNNAIVGPIEDAIMHYFTPNFDNSQGGGAIKGAFRDDKSGPDALADLGGTDAIDKMGFFLRQLSAVYSIADCERLTDEMIYRTSLGLPTELPLLHCQFALKDARFVLDGVKLPLPVKQQPLTSELTDVETQLESALDVTDIVGRKNALQEVRMRLGLLRNSIATTPELPDVKPSAPAPALGPAADAFLVLGLLSVALFVLRRRRHRDL